MAHRPYPNVGRALRQVARHRAGWPVTPSQMNSALADAYAAYLAAGQEAVRPLREMIEALGARPSRPHALYDPKSGEFALLDG